MLGLKLSKAIGALIVGCAAFLGAADVASASTIGVGTPIPDSEVIINFNGTGLDWTYAGPTAPNGFGPGLIEAPGYRAAEGWRLATANEWALRPDWEDFTRPGQSVPTPTDHYTNHTVYRFTSEYWSTYSWVDLGNAANGIITGGNGNGSSESYAETFYVRDTRAVPLPPAALLGLGALGLMGLARRRKRRQTA